MGDVSGKFFKVAVLFGLLGMALGIHMGATGVHDQVPAHAHINLLGWVSMMLFGLYYKNHEAVAGSKLALAHFLVSTLGVIVLNVAVYLKYTGMSEIEPVIGIGSFIVIGGMAIFAVNVFKGA